MRGQDRIDGLSIDLEFCHGFKVKRKWQDSKELVRSIESRWRFLAIHEIRLINPFYVNTYSIHVYVMRKCLHKYV